MLTQHVSPSVTTAALLKSQLDQGKDYFDLLVPFVHHGVIDSPTEVVDPIALRQRINARFGLDLPLRTLSVLLNRLSRRTGTGIRKEGSAFLRSPGAPVVENSAALLADFLHLGDAFADHCAGRLQAVVDTESSLKVLCAFLEVHSATLVLDDPLPSSRVGRRQDIIVASFVSTILRSDDPIGKSLTALLQGLVLARAVTLSDLSGIERRLRSLVVYFDTPFVLSIAGLYGVPDEQAARDAVKLLKDLGASPAVFDVTVAEVRRVLAVYEDRLDTAAGRAGLYRTPLTAHLFSTNATGADVRTRSALLETALKREGLTIHITPPRQREFVGDEPALIAALQDVRGEGYEARENHDLNCVAAILTFRRGRQPDTLENARAILAATGMVVRTTRAWWIETGGKGLPPVLEQTAIINYCWLKRPYSASGIHRFELAALCSSILQPSSDVWSIFKKELRKMSEDGLLSSDEASVLLVDSYASKLLVDGEETETITPGTVADIIKRVREEHQRETEAARADAKHERESRLEEQLRADERLAHELVERDARYGEQMSIVMDELRTERERYGTLEKSVSAIASMLAWALTVPVIGLIIVAVAVVAVFPLIGASSLSPTMKAVLQVLTVMFGFASSAFGLSALSLGRALQSRIERRIRSKLISDSTLSSTDTKDLPPAT
jgi:hypothetical protein